MFTKAANRSLFWKSLRGTTFTILDSKSHGLGDIGKTSIPKVTPVYGRNFDGLFESIMDVTTPPGDFDTVSITYLDTDEDIHPLTDSMRTQESFYLQRLTYTAPPINSRVRWTQLEHLKLVLDGGTLAASPNRDGTDGPVENTVQYKITEYVRLKQVNLSRLSIAGTEDVLSIAGLANKVPGVAGVDADAIIFFGLNSDGSTPASIFYSLTGGGGIAAIGTDPSPFTEFSGISALAVDIISSTQFRLIAGKAATTAVAAKFAYQDFLWIAANTGAALSASSWNVKTIAAATPNIGVAGFYWLKEEDRLYILAGTAIYVSEDSGESDPGAAIYSGAAALAAITEDKAGNVWAVGASGLILREAVNKRDVFVTRTAPSGASAFTAIAFATDGSLFAGFGTTLIKSLDSAGSVSGWITLRDFGTNKKIVGIQVKEGASQCLRVVADDTTGSAQGTVWESEDGGNTWRSITATAHNLGYNCAYFPKDVNLALIGGDVDGSSDSVIDYLS